MEQDKIPPEETKADKNNPANPIKPIIVTEIAKSADSPTPPKGEQNNTKQDKYRKFKIWIKHNGIQSALALATIGSLIAYIFISKSQISLTREAIRKSDEANAIARASIDYTKKTNEDAGKIRRAELMAYIAIKSIGWDFIDPEGEARGFIILENTGKTPSNRTRIVYNSVRFRSFIDSTDFKKIKKTDTIIGTNLIPGTPMTVDFKVNLRGTVSYKGFPIKKTDVFIYGFVRYDDIFGISQENRFVFKFNPLENSTTPIGINEANGRYE